MDRYEEARQWLEETIITNLHVIAATDEERTQLLFKTKTEGGVIGRGLDERFALSMALSKACAQLGKLQGVPPKEIRWKLLDEVKRSR